MAASLDCPPQSGNEAQPDAGGRDFLSVLSPNSKTTVTALLDSPLTLAQAEDRFQFERYGHFVADGKDHTAARPVLNRSTTLKGIWAKA